MKKSKLPLVLHKEEQGGGLRAHLLRFASIGAIYSASFLSSTVFADMKVFVTTADGHRPYMIVLPESATERSDDHGVYIADEKGQWHQILKGKILTGRTVQGVLGHLDGDKFRGSFPSIAVVDGKITIFNISTSESEPKSSIVLGSTQAPYVDVLHNSELPVPDIDSVDDINIFLAPATDEGQMVLGSIRLKVPPLQGNGLTFACFVRKGQGQSLELANDPVVIDYQFRETATLKKLTDTPQSSTSVFSETILQWISKVRSSDPRAVASWKNEVAGARKTVAFGLAPRGTPYYDVLRGDTVVPNPIVVLLGRLGKSIYQIYDPLHGIDGVVVSESAPNRIGAVKLDKLGRVDIDANGQHRFYFNRSVPKIGIAFIQGKLTVLFEGENEPYFLTLEDNFNPELLSFFVHTEKGPGTSQRHSLILSTRRGKENQTRYYEIHKSGLGFEVDHSYVFSDEYYSGEEIKARTHVLQGGQVLFDNLTPRQRTVEAYQQAAPSTIPYLDLIATRSPDNLVQAYRQAIDVTEVSKVGAHKVFEAKGAIRNHTGLYIEDRDKQQVRFVRGQLLRKQGDDRAELTARVVRLNKSDTPTRMTLVALDAGMDKGEAGFTLASVVSFDGHSASDAPKPFGVESTFKASFEQLSGVYWMIGGHQLTNTIHLLLRFAPTTNPKSDNPEGGIYVLTLRVTAQPGKGEEKAQYNLERVREQWLEQHSITEGELQSRLRRDTSEGRLFYVLRPEIDPSASNYALLDLLTGKEILPNSHAERGRRFVAEEASQEVFTNLGSPLGSQASAWEIYNPNRLRERAPESVIKGFLDRDHVEKQIQSESLFPKLRERLNTVSGLTEPAKHRVFIVPEHVKEDFLRAAYFSLAERDPTLNSWSFRNPRLKFYLFDKNHASQGEVSESMTAMRLLASQNKVVLFADAADLSKVNRPEALVETGERQKINYEVELPDEAGETSPYVPHSLYWITTEGERLSPEQLQGRETKDKKVDVSIVATPAEWQQLTRQAEPESKAGFLQDFEVDTTFMHGTWKLWPQGTPKTKERVTRVAQMPFSEFENEVFPHLAKILVEAANPEQAPKHQVLIVPQELKTNVSSLVLSRWVHGKSQQDPWRETNANLSLSWLDPALIKKQHDILENLDSLRLKTSPTRSALVADLADIIKVGRTAETDGGDFYLHELSIPPGETHHSDHSGTKQVTVSETKVSPHLLYLLATEGKRLQLEEFKAKPVEPRISEILIGTQAEWQQLKEELNPEDRAQLADRFEVVSMPAPSIAIRKQMLRKILERPEISSLRYRFDAKGVRETEASEFPQEEAADAILGFMVNRCELLAKQGGKEVISSFVRLLNAFHVSLVKDEVLRRRQVIDRIFVERLFSKIFSMPLNVAVLPPEDPLTKLSRQDAAMELQQAGYEGPLDFKTRVIQSILAQTRVDPIRPIPSSVILFGETRSGKTFLFKTLCKMLGLKMYDYSRPTDTAAQAIIINVAKLRPNTKEESGKETPLTPAHSEVMTVDQAMKHLFNFLSLPNGYRGFILLDDVHLASDEVRAQIVTVLRSLFDATGGLYRVKNHDSKTVEITTRNLTLFMTLNPPDDVEKLKKFSKTGDDLERVLASLAGKDVNVDRSFLERWGLILNLSLFPVEAKAPKLRDSVREAARDTFNNQNKLILVAPSAIQFVAEQFKDENASFLSRATPELIGRTSDFSDHSPLSIIVPRRKNYERTEGHVGQWGEASGRNGTEIEHFIQTQTIALPVVGRVDGQLEMLRLLVDTFRAQVLENFVRAIGQDPQYAGTIKQQRNLLSPLLHSTVAHFMTKARIPINMLQLDPHDFNATTTLQRDRFVKLVEEYSEGPKRYFDVRFGDEMPSNGLLASLLDHTFKSREERNRAHVLTETVETLKPEFEKLLSAFLRVDSLTDLPSAQDWLLSLPAQDSMDANNRLGRVLAMEFRHFYESLYSEDLTESLNASKFEEISTYDAARLFMLVIDKTITKLAWAKSLHFLINGLDLASRHMELGQLAGVQHYIFSSKFSAVRPTTHDLVIQLASNSDTYRRTDAAKSSRMASMFESKCRHLLVQPMEGGENGEKNPKLDP